MVSPTEEILPPEVEAAVREAVSRVRPDGDISRIRVCEVTQNRYVVRVYLAVPKLKPSPYRIYRVGLPKMIVTHLQGDEAKPYLIANHK